MNPQWAHEQNGRSGRDGGYAWAQQHELALTRLTWLQLLLGAHSVSSRDNTDPLIEHHFPWRAACYLGAGWLRWPTYIMKGAAFSSYWNRHLLWIQICLLFWQNHYPWTYRMPHSSSWHSTWHCYLSRNSLQKKCSNRPMPCNSYHVLYHLKAAGLIEDGLLETQLQHKVVQAQCFAGLGQFSEDYVCSESASGIWSWLSCS